MALFDKEGRLVWMGVAIGAWGATALPFIAPVVGAIARPLTKAVLTHGWLALEASRERAAHMAEGLEDILAEVQAEAHERLAARKAAAREAAGAVAQAGEAAGRDTVSKGVN